MKTHWVWGLNKDKWIRRKGEYWAKAGVLSHRERERERSKKLNKKYSNNKRGRI